MLTLLSAQLCLVPALAAVSLGKDGSLLVAEPGALRVVDPQGAESWKVVIDSTADEPLVTQSMSASGTLFASVGPRPLDSFSGGPPDIYVNNSVLALNSQDGSLKWNVSVPCKVRVGTTISFHCAGAPVLAGDIVYVHVAAPVFGDDGYVVALDAEDGSLLWNVSTGWTRKRLDPMVLAQGTVLLAGINSSGAHERPQNGTHLALWPNGTQRWLRADLGCGAKTRARSSGGSSTIYMVSADDCFANSMRQNLWALAEEDGRLLWSREVPGAVAPIVVEGSSMLYLYSYARPYGAHGFPANVTAFDVDGELRWAYDMGARPDPRLSPTPEFSVSTGLDGIDTLHFSNASVLLALREGQKLWEVDLMNGSVCGAQYCSFSAPTVVQDGTVLASGGAPGQDVPTALHAVRDGQHMWSLESTVHCSFQVPVLGENGVTFVPELSWVIGQQGSVQVSAVDSTGAVLWVDGRASEQAAVVV